MRKTLEGGAVMGARRALILLLLLLWCPAARAQTPYDPALRLWYPALTPAQQEIFDLCYQAAATGQAQVSLPPGSRYADASLALRALVLDCPELSWLGRRYALRYYQDSPEEAVSVTLRLQPAGESGAVLAAARALCAGAPEDPWERALYLHDALCRAVSYGGTARAYDAMGALVEGQAVCEGYANAYALLCRLSGLRCGILTGEASGQPHAWNLVELPDGAMLVDVTWDDQEAAGLVAHSCFGLTDDWMAQTHQPESFLTRPVCQQENLNWHVRQGLALGRMAEDALADWLLPRLQTLEAGQPLELRFLDASTRDCFLAHWDLWLQAAEVPAGRWSCLSGVSTLVLLYAPET